MSDGRGGTSTASTTATINGLPIARPGGPYAANVGEPLLFDGTGSSDPDGDPLTYAWDFGDGTKGSGASPTHTYTAPGSFTVSLTVDDGRGATHTATTSATISEPPPPNQAPTANPGGPYSGIVGAPVSFDGTGSSDPDGDPLTYAWDFGDGAKGTGPTPTHTYTAAGSFTVSLTVDDGRGGTHTATTSATIAEPPPDNQAPTANAGGPYNGTVGSLISFDGTGSSDPDGDQLTYAWDFGDGAKGAGATPTHTYATPGSFTVLLTVDDGRGGTHTATTSATIGEPPPDNQAPTANPGGPYSGTVGSPITFDGTGSSDPDGDLLTYAWEFGDGAKGTGGTPTHTYTTPGSFTVSLTVDDGRGGSHTATVDATIAEPPPDNQAPTANPGGPYSGTVGSPISFDGTGSSDPDGDPLTYAWDFGDGAKDTGATPTHTYKTSGSFTVSLTVNDGRGGIHSAATSASIGVPPPVNQPPVAKVGGPYSGLAGQSVSFDASGSSDPDGDPLSYSWNFGDGNTGTGASPTHTYLQAGSYKVSVTVSDGRGGSDTAATVADIGQPPLGNRHPVASAGGPYASEVNVLVGLDGSGSFDPDGDLLTYSWDFGDGSQGSGRLAKHAYDTAGDYTVTLTVHDGRGGTDSATAVVRISAATDRMPPVVTLNAPREALPGTQVTVTVHAVDNVGVASVEIAVDGGAPVSFTQPPYQRTIQVPSIAAPGDTIEVSAQARDASGNTGSARATIAIVAAPDIVPPVVTLNAPPQVGRGTTLTVSAYVTDAVGVADVQFVIDGQPFAIQPGAPLVASYPVAADRPLDAPIPVLVRARDFAGNLGEADALVLIAAEPDTTPPTAVETVPEQIAQGEPLTITVDVDDDVGVASVELIINGVVVDTVTNPPFTVQFDVSDTLLLGALLDVKIVVRDFSGNTTEVTTTVVIVSSTALVRSLVTGEVYDDTTGLPLEGARVVVRSQGGLITQALSDSRGRFGVPAREGFAVVQVTMDGWTRAVREATLEADTAVEIFDVRLTPLAPATEPVSPVLGAMLSRDGYELDLAGGALETASGIRLTAVTQQGTVALLPVGWSPVAGVEVGPRGLVFIGAHTLRPPKRADLQAGTPVAVARFDGEQRRWTVIAIGAIDPDGTMPVAAIAGGGEYAWVVADTLPATPPAAAIGQALDSAGPAAVPERATAVITPQPRVIFYQPGVFSDVGNRIADSHPMQSGAHVQVRISESYQFFSGLRQHPEPFTQDLVLFQTSDPPEVLEARHRVSPSLTFEALALELGVITLDLAVPEPGARTSPLIGPNGGTVAGPSGEELRLPPGAGAEGTAFALQRLGADQLDMALPEGLAFVAGVRVMFTGQLAEPGTLSVPRPADLFDASGVLVARVQPIGGEDRLILVAAARIVGDRLESDTTLGDDPQAFEGIRVGGRYVFVRPTTLFGFVVGRVLAGDGATFPGALVTTPTLPLAALSRPEGYIAAGALGPVPLTALDLIRLDAGMGEGLLSAPRQVAALDLTLTANPPVILSITPAHEASNVPLGTAVVARFSRPIDPTTAQAGGIALTGPAGIVAGSIAWSVNGTMLTFRPAAALVPDAVYTFTVTPALRDLTGRALVAGSTTTFESLDTNPPPMPPAGSITAGFPDSSGSSTVRGSQGTAGRNDTVTILNVTRGTSTPVILDPDGGFLTLVEASLSDKLRVRIVDAAGNETFVDLPRFRQVNADGSVSTFVGPEGGKVDGPNGTAVDVPEGAFPDGVRMTLTYVPETQFPIQLTADDKKFFAYSGGVKIDMDGQIPAGNRYLNLSLAAEGSETAEDQWIVGHTFQANGKTFFNTVDTAKVIGGRITTSSPPCPGVKAAEVYGFAKSLNRPVGVNWARTGRNRTNTVLHGVLNFYTQLGAVAGFGSGGLAGMAVAADLHTSATVSSGGLFPDVVCLPSLSGRATIVPNAVFVTIGTDHQLPGDSRVTVRNVTRNSERVLPLYAAALNVAVPTLSASYYEVRAEMSAFTFQDLGTTAPDNPAPLFDVTPGSGGETIISVEPEWLTGSPKAISVDQVFSVVKGEAEDRGSAGIAIRVNGATTDYRVFFVRDDGSEDELDPLQFTVGRISPTQVEVLITTVERLAANLTGFRIKYETRTVLGEPRPLHLSIEGAPDDTIAVEFTGGNKVSRPVPFTRSGSTAPSGNLILKILPATLDPPVTQPEELGRLPDSVRVINKTRGTQIDVPEHEIVNGGVEIGFVDEPFDASHDYVLVIGWRGQSFGAQLPTTTIISNGDVNELHIPIPRVEVTVYDLATFAPVKTITGFVPPRNEPANIPRLDDDNTEPTLLTTAAELTDIDPAQSFSLRFSESMDALSLQQGIFLECGGQNIAGEVRISDLNRTVTFVPTAALPLGKSCTVYLQVSDASGNLIDVQYSSIALTTFTPVLVGTSPEVLNLRDIAHLPQQAKETVVGITRGASTYQVITFDVTDPALPTPTGAAPASTFVPNNTTWRIVTVPAVQDLPLRTLTSTEQPSSCRGGATEFTGDLAIIGRYNVNMSGVQFYNVTNATDPCILGEKYLTADPTGIAYDRLYNGTIHLPGYAKGVTAIRTSSAILAYAAVQEVGLLAADVGANSPQPLLENRVPEGAVYGNYVDVVSIRDHLFALDVDRGVVDVLTPTLALVGSGGVHLQNPRGLLAVEGYTRDDNANGVIDPTERRDLLFVAGSSAITILEVTTARAPTFRASIPFEGSLRGKMSFDLARKWLAAISITGVPTVFDLSVLEFSGDRRVWEAGNGHAQTLAFDSVRGLLYAGRYVRHGTVAGSQQDEPVGVLDVWDIAGHRVRALVDGQSRDVVVDVDREVRLNAVSNAPPANRYAYSWQFGDGAVSDLQHPTHTFSKVETVTARVEQVCQGVHPSHLDSPAVCADSSDTVEVKVVRAQQFDIQLAVFIPYNNVLAPPGAPGGSCINPDVLGADGKPVTELLYFEGDDRSFDPAAESFRARQRISVISGADRDALPDGTPSGSCGAGSPGLCETGVSRSYAPDAIGIDGRIKADADDAELLDCHLLHAVGKADPSSMSTEVMRVSEKQIRVKLTGAAGNPLVLGAPAIDWSLTLHLLTDGDLTRWALAGRHDGFPAFELYINGNPVYQFAPSSKAEIIRLFDVCNDWICTQQTVEIVGTLSGSK